MTAGKLRQPIIPRLLKGTLNRLTARMALAGVGPFSLVRHVGRKSGRSYQTPVILAEVPDGFVAELTYGDTVDWYRNVVAAGGCTVIHDGHEYRITSIESYDARRGRDAFPAPASALLKLLHRSEFRLLRHGGGRRCSQGRPCLR